MYTDGLTYFEGAETQGEAAAAVIALRGDTSEIMRFPGGAEVLEFGTITTEAWDVAGANANKVQLKKATVEGGTYSAIATITHPKTAGAAPSAVGVRNVSTLTPINVKPGECLKFEVSQAASDAGGAFVPYIIVRLNGHGGPNTAAPVVRYSA